MAESYLSQLKAVEAALEHNGGVFSEAIVEQLYGVVSAMKEQRISVEEYLKVMQLFFRKYEKEHNREGQHYCAIRMVQLQHYLKSRSSRRQKYERIEGRTIPNEYVSFIYDKSRFYRQTFRVLQLRLLLLNAVLFLVLFVFFSFVLQQTNSVSFIESLALVLANFLFSYIRMPRLFMRNQLEAAGKNVENVLLEFDFPIVSNNP